MKQLSEIPFILLIFLVVYWELSTPKLNPDDGEWMQAIQKEREDRSFQLGMEYYLKLDEKYGNH